MLKRQLNEANQAKEKAEEEMEKHIIRVDKQKYATNILDEHIKTKSIIEKQLMRRRSGIGYNETPPPLQSVFAPSGKELSFIDVNGLIKSAGETSKSNESSKAEKVYSDAPIIEDWVSDSEDEQSESDTSDKQEEIPKTENSSEKQVRFTRPVLGHAISRKIAEYKEVPREQFRKIENRPRGNQRNFNGLVSNKLGSNFELRNKACYNCGSFEHLKYNCVNYQKPIWNQYNRVNHQNGFQRNTHPHPNVYMIPRAVLMRTGETRTIYAARPKRPFQQHKTTAVNKTRVNHAAKAVVHSAAKPKFVTDTVVGNHFYAVKASACWIWKPKGTDFNQVSRNNSASQDLKKFDYVDAQGRSK